MESLYSERDLDGKLKIFVDMELVWIVGYRLALW
jgi:hypothetical protein